MREIVDYPCPECGYDGPHVAHRDDDPVAGGWFAECGACVVEFPVPDEDMRRLTP